MIDFPAHAHEFDTRRELCDGTWLVTKDSIQLVNGSCNGPRLPDVNQLVITQNTLVLATYYIPVLSEYLGPFASYRNQSQWLIPTFTTVTAAMYWSRILAINGYYSWTPGGSPEDQVRDEV